MTAAMENLAMKRKMQLAEFGELFKALFKIPDRDIHLRVLDAVNGIIKETCDCLCCKKDVAEKGTQTKFLPGTGAENYLAMKREIPAEKPVNGILNGGREIKRRKRNRKVPCVQKSINEPEPFLAKPAPSLNLMQIVDPNEVFDWNLDKMSTISDPEDPVKNKEDLKEKMRIELKLSLIYDMKGLLPIHKAIKTNDIKSLKRKLWVLNYQNVNLNEILTDAGETLIEYAIKVDTCEAILKELLDRGVSINEIDAEGNNILHLAMMCTENKHLLLHLLEKLGYLYLEFLKKKNDKGLTVLHMGVKNENLSLCKALVDFVDRQFNLTTVGKDELDFQKLKDIYLKNLNDFPTKKPVQLHVQKMELINAVDVMQGRTPLFHAVAQNSQNSKLLVYMLLCHLADPLLQDLAGLDCLTYVETVENISPQIQGALRNTASYLEICSEN